MAQGGSANDGKLHVIGSYITRVSMWVSVAKHMWWLISGIVVVCGPFVAQIIKTPEPVRFIVLGVGTFLIGLIVGGYIFRHVSVTRDADLGYRVMDLKIVLSFDDTDLLKHRMDTILRIQARRRSIQLIDRWYAWTGGNAGQAPPIRLVDVDDPDKDCNDARIVADQTWAEDGRLYYYIRFDHPLSRREFKTIRIRQDFYDSDRTFQSQLKTLVENWADHLSLTVHFPMDAFPDESHSKGVTYRKPGSSRMGARRLPLNRDASKLTLNLEVKAPKSWRTYAIEWDWAYPRELQSSSPAAKIEA